MDNNSDTIRERVESTREEITGGSETGYQGLEDTVAETRSGGTWQSDAAVAGAQPASGAGGNVAVAPETDQSTPPFNDEHPLGIGQQCFKCGAYNEVGAATCWNCDAELSSTATETPGIVESVQPADEDALPTISAGDTTGSDTTGGASPL